MTTMIPALLVWCSSWSSSEGGGFVWNVLWYILIAALILWAIGFLLRSAEGGGRWYRW
jgi:hypothetical protein